MFYQEDCNLSLLDGKTIAVIGDNATRRMSQGGVGAGVKALYEITPLQGLQKALEGTGITLKHAQGYTVPSRMRRNAKNAAAQAQEAEATNKKLAKEAVALAKEADLVIFVGGDNREVETEGSDRKDINLPAGQDELIKAIAQANPNLVTIMVVGAPVDLRTVNDCTKGLLISWFNGSEGGHALADVLTGRVNPAGRTVQTWVKDITDLPPMMDYDIRHGRTYLYHQGDVLYPFGHGLSYTTFDYTRLHPGKQDKTHLRLDVTVKNTGSVDGEEVVQIYASWPQSKVERPLKKLCAFRRVFIPAGQSLTVCFTIDKADLGYWDDARHAFTVEPGPVLFMAGASSQDIRLEKVVKIK